MLSGSKNWGPNVLICSLLTMRGHLKYKSTKKKWSQITTKSAIGGLGNHDSNAKKIVEKTYLF